MLSFSKEASAVPLDKGTGSVLCMHDGNIRVFVFICMEKSYWVIYFLKLSFALEAQKLLTIPLILHISQGKCCSNQLQI